MTSSPSRRARTRVEALAAASPQPLYAQLRERLRASILDGRLKPAQRLPSEHELVRTHGVSRITVRQALEDLRAQGLVVKVQGKGSFVAPPRVQQDLSQLRGLAETVAGSGLRLHTRVLRLGEAVADEETARRLGLGGAGDDGHADDAGKVTELVTLRYLDRQPLSLNRTLIVPALGARLPRAELAERDLLTLYEERLGVVVGHADLEIRATAATAEQARQLRVDAGWPLLHVRRTVYDRGGRPLHLETSALRSDEFSYRLRLPRTHAGV